MKTSFFSLIFGTFLASFFLTAPVSVRAVDPDLIDVVEIVGTDPIIVHTNILPGDSFMKTITIINHTDVPQNIGMKLDLDASEGFVSVLTFELEEQLYMSIKRAGVTEMLAPGTTLQMLHNTVIHLGVIPAKSTETYDINTVFDENAGNEYQNTKVYFNLNIGIEVDDAFVRPRLLIEKSNNVDPVVEEPGDEVTYTLTVTAPEENESDLHDVTVTDVPPAGFVYIPGSGTGAPFLHEYASPGVWSLGTMAPGQVKTLTYKTKISTTQDAGLYKDLAWAKGTSQIGTTVLAEDSNDADNFVGTQVAVALPESSLVTIPQDTQHEKKEKVVKKTQYVLGASTLPFTGANVLPIFLALVFLSLGIFLMVVGRRHRLAEARGMQETPLASWFLMLLVGSFCLFGQPAQAATMAVDIEKPKAVIHDANFPIGFVVLDILGRSVTVECYEGTSISPFATYALDVSGGSSGNCQIDGAVMPVDGDYTFYVKAIASGEEDEIVESVHVNVKLLSGVPGTPYNYVRHDASCQNVITFTTANDGGKTVRVELYRSLSRTFSADVSTKVDEIALGSNVSGSFTEVAPGCSNDWFYVVRAFDMSGTGSQFVGDVDINHKTDTKTTTKTTTVTLPGATNTGAVAVSGGAVEGQVQGAETTTDETMTGANNQSEGAVLGDETLGTEASALESVKQHPWFSGMLVLLVIIMGSFGYYSLKRKYDHPIE